jgi:hypothetical protein
MFRTWLLARFTEVYSSKPISTRDQHARQVPEQLPPCSPGSSRASAPPEHQAHAGRRSASVRIPRLELRNGGEDASIVPPTIYLPAGPGSDAVRGIAGSGLWAPGPAGRRAAHLHSEAGAGSRAGPRVTAPTGKPQPRSWQATAGGGAVQNRRFLRQRSLPHHNPSSGRPEPVSEINVAQPAVSWGCETVSGMGHLLGYARVSTTDQQSHLQVDALERAGCYRVFTETASGTRTDRPSP